MKSICPERIRSGAHQDGGGHAQAHDDAGGVDKDAGAQLALDGDLLMVVDLLVEPGQIPDLLVGGADLPDILQRLLDAVGDADSGLFRPLGGRGRRASRVPNSRPKATGTPHRQAMASRQSYTSRHTAMSAVEM